MASRAQTALRQIVANAPTLRSTIARAQQNGRATGNSVTTELRRLAARGDGQASRVLNFMSNGGGSGSTGGRLCQLYYLT